MATDNVATGNVANDSAAIVREATGNVATVKEVNASAANDNEVIVKEANAKEASVNGVNVVAVNDESREIANGEIRRRVIRSDVATNSVTPAPEMNAVAAPKPRAARIANARSSVRARGALNPWRNIAVIRNVRANAPPNVSLRPAGTNVGVMSVAANDESAVMTIVKGAVINVVLIAGEMVTPIVRGVAMNVAQTATVVTIAAMTADAAAVTPIEKAAAISDAWNAIVVATRIATVAAISAGSIDVGTGAGTTVTPVPLEMATGLGARTGIGPPGATPFTIIRATIRLDGSL